MSIFNALCTQNAWCTLKLLNKLASKQFLWLTLPFIHVFKFLLRKLMQKISTKTVHCFWMNIQVFSVRWYSYYIAIFISLCKSIRHTHTYIYKFIESLSIRDRGEIWFYWAINKCWKHSVGFQYELTERAPVMRALCVRVAGLRRWYPISGVPLFEDGFNIVSKLPLVGALIDADRVLTRGGVDS